jgi:hypothetical protein
VGEKGPAGRECVVGEVIVLIGSAEEVVGLVVIERGCEGAFAAAEVVLLGDEVCAVAARDVGEPTVGADFAWKEGLVVVRARKAEKKFEKK